MNADALHEALDCAAQLEHALMCEYLFAAITLRRSLTDCDGDAVRAHRIIGIERELLRIAHEEMLHLAAVWDIQLHLGQTPNAGLPPFEPLTRQIAGAEWRWTLALEPLNDAVCERLLRFESRHDERRVDDMHGLYDVILAALPDAPYESGGAYAGSWARFVAAPSTDTMDEAVRVLTKIVSDEDTGPMSHAARLNNVRNSVRELGGDVSLPAVALPGARDGSVAERIAALCDDAYTAIMMSLVRIQRIDDESRDAQRHLARRAMSGVLRALFEVLATQQVDSTTSAGPAFIVTADLGAPKVQQIATVIDGIASRCHNLAGHAPRLAEIGINARQWRDRLLETSTQQA